MHIRDAHGVMTQTFRFDGEDLVTPAVIQLGKKLWCIRYTVTHTYANEADTYREWYTIVWNLRQQLIVSLDHRKA